MDNKIFNNALSRAADLMNNPEFIAKVEGAANKERIKNGYVSKNTTFVNENVNTYVPQQNTSSLPEAIRRSFDMTPPITYENTPNNIVTENIIPNNNILRQQVSAVGMVDYSLIKSLIDESISRHLSEIKDKIINESANGLRAFKFSDGNKVQFLDNKGNLYEGELKLKKKKKEV